MNFHIDQVMDFVQCPALYAFRHQKEIDPSLTVAGRANKNSILELYDKAMHKAVLYLFHSAQDGFYPALNHLAHKWGYLWVKPRSDQEDVRFKETSWRDVHERKRKQGWRKLQEVWAYYDQPGNMGHPIMVGYPYRIEIGRHTLCGEIDLVQVKKDQAGREYIELVEFLVDVQNAPFVHIRRDWRVTAASYAFRKIMNVREEKIVYHGIISGKLLETTRTDDDYKQLESLLDSMEKAQAHQIYYPVFNERCLTCPYEKHCEKGWE
jgi:hypothetical protein